ncbi:sigma-54-dependent Fis family transcriptional regulator [Maribrevibacterium harenarium]|uniref:Sigma-54-dependent Fis family transcriptional regulator n=1 Tax=Maribrevibacterium harenarium TaxID=2589817 RepID=A0A501WXY9_9GAMM|nr:sigma-54 dependent transcriptional regulator [Maribrevibacterium harenarium]TPE53370.1 sigma-54-dependent Fis family transcriptional regulator [Maribrevibacterium harenarium]
MPVPYTGTVLLVDDDPMIRKATEKWLQMAGLTVICADSAEQALPHLNDAFPGILLTDVKMPGMSGLELMQAAHERIPDLPVILVTGHGDIDMAIQAMRDGAYDFIEKPFVPERLVETLIRACDKRALMLENSRLQTDLAARSGIDGKIIGFSPAITRLKRELLAAAEMDTNVIIYGETGSGKELVAQCLHEFSPRKTKRFVPINCGAIPEHLIESELFGHEAGAFTGAAKRRIGKFEHADGGTLFLDEIESTPAHLQIKILRALQEGQIERLGANQTIPVNIRVIAASKADLRDDENFRQDLFYRLNVSQLYIPPLRERTEDVPLLFMHYVNQAATERDKESRQLSVQDEKVLRSHQWPGNVRELKNIAIRFALDSRASLADLVSGQPAISYADEVEHRPLPLAIQVAAFEAEVLKRALHRHQGNIKAVMDELDLPRRTLNQKMTRYGLNRSDFTG